MMGDGDGDGDRGERVTGSLDDRAIGHIKVRKKWVYFIYIYIYI